MNFLAHAYLSFNDNGLIIGNMISDFVKGKKMYGFPESIQKGIRLHRMIDNFTDAHPVVNNAKQVFKPATRLYAGAFVDVAFDYFLANDPSVNSAIEWELFSQNIYRVLQENIQVLPPDFLPWLQSMIRHDWLYNYRFGLGIENSFHHLVRRAKFLENNQDIFPIFETNLYFLNDCYKVFFPDLLEFTKNEIQLPSLQDCV